MQLESLMVLVGIMLLASVFANRLSVILGIPGLLLFICIGMLAGNDGIGAIQFYNSEATNQFGMIALAFILFSGGLDTRWESVRPVLFRGTLLATAGVMLTALFLFVCAYYVLAMPLEAALLLSVIVSSTDAPAVFMIMKNQRYPLRGSLRPLLEFESGSNDPMAVLLSIMAMRLLETDQVAWPEVFKIFSMQLGIGVFMGIGVGKVAVYILRRYCIGNFGLYTVFGIAVVLLGFGFTQLLGGSGFLAVYICGIVLRNSPFLYRRSLIRFHDSVAWIMQIFIFLLLGLLVNPNELPGVFPVSVGCAFSMIFIARPLAVYICLIRSKYNFKEKFFISWAGLKGAVPIILATYPLMMGFPNAQFLFNLIFFLVLISVLLQGKLLNFWAEKLNLYKNK